MGVTVRGVQIENYGLVQRWRCPADQRGRGGDGQKIILFELGGVEKQFQKCSLTGSSGKPDYLINNGKSRLSRQKAAAQGFAAGAGGGSIPLARIRLAMSASISAMGRKLP